MGIAGATARAALTNCVILPAAPAAAGRSDIDCNDTENPVRAEVFFAAYEQFSAATSNIEQMQFLVSA